MSKRVLKNYQVNLGSPFYVKAPLSYDTIKKIPEDNLQTSEQDLEEEQEDPSRILEKAREDAEKEASFILEAVKLEAAKIIEEAEEEAARRAAEIESKAAERGYIEGMETARQQYEDLLKEAELIREQARAEYSMVLEQMESDIVDMILAIARKVIDEEVRINKKNILFLVRQAFERCSNKDEVVLRVAADDYQYLEENEEKILGMVEGVGELEVKKDPSLKPGACILETPLGSVDASVETKLEKIEEEFRKAAGNDVNG